MNKAELQRYMLTREHFPLVVKQYSSNIYSPEESFRLERVVLPPFHPSIFKNGIPFKESRNLINKVLEETAKDFESVKDRLSEVRSMSETHKKQIQENNHIILSELSEDEIFFDLSTCCFWADSLYIGEDFINPYGEGQDHSVEPIKKRMRTFSVPKKVVFSKELMKEYEIQLEEEYNDKNFFSCPNLPFSHNLTDFSAIFYKNLIIAFDNHIVRNKYS